jgi:hypothetical protein
MKTDGSSLSVSVNSPTAHPPPPKPIRFSFLTADGSAAHLKDLQRQQQALSNGVSSKNKAPAKKTRKQLEAMRPAEYAEHISSQWTEDALKGKPAEDLYLKGKKIFYCDTDQNLATLTTRNHLDTVCADIDQIMC